MRSIIVYGKTIDRAINQLERILHEPKHGEVHKVKKGRNSRIVELKNGDVYRAVLASEGARGYRWHYAYIDSLIDSDIVNQVIYFSRVVGDTQVFETQAHEFY